MRNYEDRRSCLGSRDADRAAQARRGGRAVRRKPDAGGGGVGRQPAHLVSLAGIVPAWRMGSVGRTQAWWASTQARWPFTALDLPNSVQQEPAAATEVSVRARDRRDGADTDCRALQSEAEPQLSVSIATSARAERTAPAVAGVSAKPRGGEALVDERSNAAHDARARRSSSLTRRVCDRTSTAEQPGVGEGRHRWSRARAHGSASI